MTCETPTRARTSGRCYRPPEGHANSAATDDCSPPGGLVDNCMSLAPLRAGEPAPACARLVEAIFSGIFEMQQPPQAAKSREVAPPRPLCVRGRVVVAESSSG